MSGSRRRPAVLILGLTAVVGAGLLTSLATSGHDARANAEVAPLPASGTVRVLGHGNGHGHGLSQWGAQGAALKGLTVQQILDFYYPNTVTATLAASTVRVQISGAGTTTVSGATSVKSGTTTLALTVATHYRLVPSGAGLALQKLSGTTWTAQSTLGAQADFSSTAGFVRLYLTDGTSADYRGTVGALRSGSGAITVNRVALDDYTRGVVPRESPASWLPAALQAQSVAARSYARNAVESAGSAPTDICDTTQCQVYGGMTHYTSGGTRDYGEEASTNSAVAATANQVRQSGGKTIFAQFSASNGGATSAGGQPYLIARLDPYDTAASGDPWIDWTRDVPVSTIASAFGLRSVSAVEITSRNGIGDWGGQVLAGYVDGIASDGSSAHVAATGVRLQSAMGLPRDWFVFQTAPLKPTQGGTVVTTSTSSLAMIYRSITGSLGMRAYITGRGWQAPVDLGQPAGGQTWDPDASSWGSGHIDLVTRDNTGHLVTRSYSPDAGWSAWRQMSPVMSSSPAAASATVNDVDIVYLGTGHTLWTLRWTKATGWSAPHAIPGIANAASGPDAFGAPATQSVTVAYRGTEGKLWTTTRNSAGTWSAAAEVNPTHAMPAPSSATDPSVVDCGSGRPSVYYTATDGVIYHSALGAGSVWSTWIAVPNSAGATSGPDVATNTPTHVDMVAGYSGQLRSTAWTAGSGWRSWSPVA